jgi:hypothetical protein
MRRAFLSPDEKREAILELWSGEKHYTSAEIGEKLGISKNSVVGIVNRARAAGDRRAVFRGDASPLANKSKNYPPKPPHEKRIKLRRKGFDMTPSPRLVPAQNVKTVFNIGFLECHYPIDSMTRDGFQIYCGEDASEIFKKHKRSYCVEHHKRMYYKPKNYVEKSNA